MLAPPFIHDQYPGRKRMSFSRGDFLTTTALGSLALGLQAKGSETELLSESGADAPQAGSGKRPIIVCVNSGFAYLDGAYEHCSKAGGTLDSAMLVVTGPEDV